MNIQNIINAINSPPITLQIAKDEKWEKCRIIDVKRLPTDQEITEYVSKTPFKRIAIEALFQQSEGVYILGLVYNSHLKTKSPNDFLTTIISITRNFRDFVSYIHSLDEKLIGEPYLLQQKPDVIRIGVVNYWFSLGPIPVWKKGMSKILSNSHIAEALASNPKTYSTSLNYQAMSFVCNLEANPPGLCHWIKSPCAKKREGIWTIDTKIVQRYLQVWEGIITK